MKTSRRALIFVMLALWAGLVFADKITKDREPLKGSSVQSPYSMGTTKVIHATESLLPFAVNENFEAVTFPPTGWTVVNPDAPARTWERTTLASGYGTGAASARINFFAYSPPTGQQDSLKTPVVTGLLATDSLIFDYAYCRYDTDYDTVEVYLSVNGGLSFPTLLDILTWNDSTAPGTTSNWAPTSGQWATRRYNLGAPVVGNSVRVLFLSRNHFGQNFYLDNVRVGNTDIAAFSLDDPASGGSKRENTAFSPKATFKNNGTETQGPFNVRYQIYNSVPSQVYTNIQSVATLAPDSTIQVNFGSVVGGLPAGAYTIRAISLLAGDVNTANDTVNGTLSSLSVISSFPYAEDFEGAEPTSPILPSKSALPVVIDPVEASSLSQSKREGLLSEGYEVTKTGGLVLMDRSSSQGTLYSPEDAMTGGLGWITGIFSGAVNDWVRGTPAKTQLSGAHSGVKCYVTKETGTYSNSHNAFIQSPIFDLSSFGADPTLTFWHNFQSETGFTGYDAGVVEYSTDGGATWRRADSTLGTNAPPDSNWTTANSFNWYNVNSTNGPIARIKFSSLSGTNTGSIRYTENTGGWIQSTTNLGGAAGKSDVRIRFRWGTDGGDVAEGWAIDDVTIADVKMWEGDVDSLWATSGNWNPAGVPIAGDSVVIPDGTTYSPVKDSTTNGLLQALVMEDSTKLTLLPAANLTISGTMFLDSASVVKSPTGTTVFINNDSSEALSGSGIITGGSIRRAIRSGSTDLYRFESALTTVSFSGPGGYPSYMTMTAYPNTDPSLHGTLALLVPSTIIDSTNVIKTDSSVVTSVLPVTDAPASTGKWVIARPPTDKEPFDRGYQSFPNSDSVVQRVYAIAADGSDSLTTHLSFRYEQAEADSLNIPEGSLLLFKLLEVSYSAGWNLLSNPVTTTDDSVHDLYPASVFPFAYRFSGGYSADYTMDNGVGYFAKFASAGSSFPKGYRRRNETIAIVAGWNLIGSISGSVEIDSITEVPPGIVASAYFGYSSGGYSASSAIEQGKAYWVKGNASGTLSLSVPSMTTMPMKQLHSHNLLETSSSISIDDARGGHQVLYLAREGHWDVPLEMFELPPAGPAGVFDARFESGRQVELISVGGNSEITVKISSDAYPIFLSWRMEEDLGTELFVKDGITGALLAPQRLHSSGSMQIANPLINRLVFSSGQSEIPIEFALLQNYPNPFNPTTTIKYQLPVESRISFVVYNILGEQVKTLVNQIQSAGYKEQNWDGTNNAGTLVGTGVYFYRIEAVSTGNRGKHFTQVKKLLLLK